MVGAIEKKEKRKEHLKMSGVLQPFILMKTQVMVKFLMTVWQLCQTAHG
jgi:hypothetical protein